MPELDGNSPHFYDCKATARCYLNSVFLRTFVTQRFQPIKLHKRRNRIPKPRNSDATKATSNSL